MVALLQALELSALGRHQQADAALQQLGFTARLSDEVWACCRGPATARTAASAPAGTRPCKGAADKARDQVPLIFELGPDRSSDGGSGSLGPLLHRLQDAFSPSSPFWLEHGYFEEATPYFSYLYNLVRCNPFALRSSVIAAPAFDLTN